MQLQGEREIAVKTTQTHFRANLILICVQFEFLLHECAKSV